MYRYKASSLVVLGDPLGDENAFDDGVEKHSIITLLFGL